MEAYCVKCKTKRELVDPTPVFTATGTPGTRGVCAVCGTTLFRMGSTPAHDGLPKPEAEPKAPKAAKASGKTTKAAKASKSAPAKKVTAKSGAGRTGRASVSKTPAYPGPRSAKLVIV